MFPFDLSSATGTGVAWLVAVALHGAVLGRGVELPPHLHPADVSVPRPTAQAA